MKQKFSTKWTGSKRPSKKRKYLLNAPLHIRRKFIRANLSKELKKKYCRNSLTVRKDYTVKILRGKFKGKKGKVMMVKTKLMKIYVEGIQTKKMDGSNASVPLRASNLQIIEIKNEDNKMKKKPEEKKIEKKESKKEESKESSKNKSEEKKE